MEAHRDMSPAGRSGTYSNCEPSTEDKDNEQQLKYLCRNNWQCLNSSFGLKQNYSGFVKIAFWLKVLYRNNGKKDGCTLPLAPTDSASFLAGRPQTQDANKRFTKTEQCDCLFYLLVVHTALSHLRLSRGALIIDRGPFM